MRGTPVRSGLHRAARWYAGRGWHVFPLRPGEKTPLPRSRGCHDATDDLEEVDAWWTETPNANLGIHPGPSGLVVADVDIKNGALGAESWRELRAEAGDAIEDTVMCETPSGGWHAYYQLNGHEIANATEGNSPLGAGISVRVHGYYTLLPPSRTPDGEYAWVPGHGPHERDVAPLPVGLAQRLTTPPERGNGHRAARAIEGAIPGGQRNSTLTSLAGTMRRRGMATEAIEAALLVENERCEPPLPEAEVRTIAQGIARYDPATERYRLTDLGNAERLIARYGQDLRWCEPLGGWYVWDGRRWKLDMTGAVQRMAQATARAIYEEAAACDDPDDRAKIAKHALASESASRQRAMLDLAWSQPGIAVTPDVWDSDPWALNVNNGTVDLRTGELREHRRADMLTKLAPVEYAPEVTAPTWQAHLERFLPDPDLRRQVQRDLGLALVGETLEEALSIWYGTGANGKSTTSQTLERVLGEYAQSAAPNLLVASRHENHPTEIADLRGARLVFSVEIGDNRNLDEAKVKMLTGGDTKKARLMRQDFFEFPQTFSIAMLVNHLPNISGTDDGIWRRIRLIPWAVRIPEAERRPQAEILADLTAEGPGILRWLLEGLGDWRRDHRWIADAVTEATASYQADQDRLGAFLADCCEMGPHYTVSVSEFYDAYNAWCETNGQEAVGKVQAGKLLRQRGVVQRRDSTGKARRWVGVRFLTSTDKVSETSPEKSLTRKDGKTCQNLSDEDADGLTESERYYREMAEREALVL